MTAFQYYFFMGAARVSLTLGLVALVVKEVNYVYKKQHTLNGLDYGLLAGSLMGLGQILSSISGKAPAEPVGDFEDEADHPPYLKPLTKVLGAAALGVGLLWFMAKEGPAASVMTMLIGADVLLAHALVYLQDKNLKIAIPDCSSWLYSLNLHYEIQGDVHEQELGQVIQNHSPLQQYTTH